MRVSSRNYGARKLPAITVRGVAARSLLGLASMAIVTMWQHADRKCVIAVEGLCRYTVQLLTGDEATVIREQTVISADDAVHIAQRWNAQD